MLSTGVVIGLVVVALVAAAVARVVNRVDFQARYGTRFAPLMWSMLGLVFACLVTFFVLLALTTSSGG